MPGFSFCPFLKAKIMFRRVLPTVSFPAKLKAEARASLSLAWPIALSNLTHMAIFATDTAFIGHASPKSLAAAALASSLIQLLMSVGFGISMASAPMMANALGRGLHAVRDLRRTVRQAIWACWAYAAAIVLVSWHGEAIFLLLGQDPGLSADAGRYLRVIEWMAFPLLGFWVLRFFVSVLGHPRVILGITVCGILVNALGNYALVFGHFGAPAMGLVGSGISSVIACSFLFAAMVFCCMVRRPFARYAVFGRFWRPDWPRFVELWRLGLPVGVTSGAEGLLFCGAAFVVGLCGATALASHAIVMQICSTTFMVSLGLSEATTIRVGLWAGRGDRDGVAAAGNAALVLGGGLALLVAAAMLAFPRALTAPFLDLAAPGAAEILSLTRRFLILAALFQVADWLQIVAAGALRGLKDTRMHMVFILTGHLLLAAPLGVFLALGTKLGGVGVWAGFAAGLWCVALMALRRWRARDALGLIEACRGRDGGAA